MQSWSNPFLIQLYQVALFMDSINLSFMCCSSPPSLCSINVFNINKAFPERLGQISGFWISWNADLYNECYTELGLFEWHIFPYIRKDHLYDVQCRAAPGPEKSRRLSELITLLQSAYWIRGLLEKKLMIWGSICVWQQSTTQCKDHPCRL